MKTVNENEDGLMSGLDDLNADLEAELNAVYDADDAQDGVENESAGDEVSVDAAEQAGQVEADSKVVNEGVEVDTSTETQIAPAGEVNEVEQSVVEKSESEQVGQIAEQSASAPLAVDGDGNKVPSWSKFAKEKRARRRAVRELQGAEKQVTAGQLEINNLKEQLAYAENRFGTDAKMPVGIDAEKINSLREELGDDLADSLIGLSNAQPVAQANAPVDEGRTDVTDDSYQPTTSAEPQEQQSLDDLLDTMADNSPVQKLGLWQDTQPELLQTAIQVQQELNNDPEFKFHNDPEKFYTEVVRRVESNNGLTNTSQNTAPTASAPDFKESQPEDTAKLPASLSDAVGSVTAAADDDISAMSGMNPKQMMEWRNKLSPEQKDAVEQSLFGG